jgi:hypothetical protein
MRRFQVGVALVLVLALAATASAAGKKAKKAKPVRGVVVAVQKDDGKDTGTITVRVQQGKKVAANTPPEERKFTIGKTTKIEKVTGKKGQKQTAAAAFGDVTEQARVIVKANGDTVESVSIVGKAKKAKKNKAG